jgi:transcriptional regulator with XRE-family HTH domain
MNQPRLASYLRSLRKSSGLSQKELAALVGYPDEGQISRHERLSCTPAFRIALAYEAVFRIPASKLFPRLFEEISVTIELRVEDMEKRLYASNVKGREAALTARKLEWMWERMHPDQTNSPDGPGFE